jgi:hypothetical protein
MGEECPRQGESLADGKLQISHVKNLSEIKFMPVSAANLGREAVKSADF